MNLEYTYEVIKNRTHDTTGINDPWEWLWQEDDGVYVPSRKVAIWHPDKSGYVKLIIWGLLIAAGVLAMVFYFLYLNATA